MATYGATAVYGSGSYKGDLSGIDSFPAENKINPTTAECYQFATQEVQGKGFAQWDNENDQEAMVYPEPLSDSIEVTDNLGQPFYLMFDELTGLPYRVGTKVGPTNSGLLEVFTDKAATAGTGGTEIPCVLRFAEDTADREHKKIEHEETHFYLRPQDETNKDAVGYDSEGFRDSFDPDLNLYKDGAVTRYVRARDFPYNSDIVVDRKFEANRIQPELKTETSEFRLVDMDTYYLQKDKQATNTDNALSEHDYQNQLEPDVLWLSRYMVAGLDLVSGAPFSGTYEALVGGPDGEIE